MGYYIERELLTFCLSARLVVIAIRVIAPRRTILVSVILCTWKCVMMMVMSLIRFYPPWRCNNAHRNLPLSGISTSDLSYAKQIKRNYIFYQNFSIGNYSKFSLKRKVIFKC